ncbi:MAG: hypothetical protein LBE89_01370, partial [Helicobacteraceae bacterium]|nr:hypothetical protein [Helicobacteraceae bacterium]
SYSTGNISGTQYIGGIVGEADSGSSITNSYATGDVSGSEKVGGIAGYTYGLTIENNAAINPSVSASSSDVNKIVGYIYGSPTISNNFALETMSITPNGSGNAGTTKTIVELKTQSTYESVISGDGLGGLGWKFGNDALNPWRIDANKNDGLPYLYWENR